MRSAAANISKYIPGPCLYVCDGDTSEWHVVGDFGMLAPRQTWALCGRWPRNQAGWSEAVTDRRGLRIHELCRYWARIGGPWLYVRSSNPMKWHVIRDAADGPALEPALCGQLPETNGWTWCVEKPVGLDLHEDCHVRRDRLDVDGEDESWR